MSDRAWLDIVACKDTCLTTTYLYYGSTEQCCRQTVSLFDLLCACVLRW